MSTPSGYPIAATSCDCVWVGPVLAAACEAHKAWRADETRACANAAASVGLHIDCDNRGVTDPETGEVPCAIEDRGGTCECSLKIEFGDIIAKRIRARINPAI